MTDEQIMQLVKEHFTEEWCEEDGYGWTEFAGKPDTFVKFARKIIEDHETDREHNLAMDEYFNNWRN